MILPQPELFELFPVAEGPETQKEALQIKQVVLFVVLILVISSLPLVTERGDTGSESNKSEMGKSWPLRKEQSLAQTS